MSSVNRGELYKDLLSAYSKAHSNTKTNQTIQENVNEIWNNLKNHVDLTNLIEEEIHKLNNIKSIRQANLLKFWVRASEKENCGTVAPSIAVCSPKDLECSSAPVVSNQELSATERPTEATDRILPTALTPAQSKTKNEILILDSEIATLKQRKNCGLLTDEMTAELKLKKKQMEKLRVLFKKQEKEMLRHRKRRLQNKKKFEKVCEENPDLRKKLNIRSTAGRPRIEVDQPYLLQAIIDLALQGSAAHERRRDETIRTVKSLDDLVEKLREEYGITLSRTAAYLRLLPRRVNSVEGKRHVKTVPVKLIKASNDSHRKHIDSQFAATTINYLHQLASVLGPSETVYISQDDKAKVPLGLPAVNKQSPMLMHMQYRVKLPDHDFVIAKRHKLTPSVYGFCEIKSNGGGDQSDVGYSGPTFAAIRSSKHSSSTALSHARDIERIYEKTEFIQFTHSSTSDGVQKPKPVFISVVDGGPDENPRYDKVVQMYIHHFLRCDLDAIFIACNAPGRSAFNRVERRMAPLSRALCGIILPHEHYGTHLNSQGQTVDTELENTNFSFAGKALAEVWSDTIIDGYVTVSEYVEPDDSVIAIASTLSKDAAWRDRHVIYSQYLLQILKCSDEQCCSKRRSSIFKFLPTSGLPAPTPIQQSRDGLKIPNLKDIESFASLFVSLALGETNKMEMLSKTVIPYDYFCPSVQTKLADRICVCGKYYSSVASLKEHLKNNTNCKKVAKSIKAKKILGQRENEKLVLVAYDDEEDVEWAYDMDVEFDRDEVFEEPNQEESAHYPINVILNPIWEDC